MNHALRIIDHKKTILSQIANATSRPVCCDVVTSSILHSKIHFHCQLNHIATQSSRRCDVLVTLINLSIKFQNKKTKCNQKPIDFDIKSCELSFWIELEVNWTSSKERMSQIIPEAVIRQLPKKKKAEGFDVEYRLKYSGTTDTDKRTMTFVDNLWGIEVTGAATDFIILRNYLIQCRQSTT